MDTAKPEGEGGMSKYIKLPKVKLSEVALMHTANAVFCSMDEKIKNITFFVDEKKQRIIIIGKLEKKLKKSIKDEFSKKHKPIKVKFQKEE